MYMCRNVSACVYTELVQYDAAVGNVHVCVLLLCHGPEHVSPLGGAVAEMVVAGYLYDIEEHYLYQYTALN